MPQVFISKMLGSRRTTVTVAAHGLKQAGLIHYSRGRITILDAHKLETHSCECYGVIRDHLRSIAAFASNIVG